ncbi:hypothetical protein ACRYCC_12755 [Actinomadura scrupuli]|uniref:hypothetical protein n=1 Tax=Actinomadura scrupuli TaxID=559629 RepID=UPI003D995969
MSPQEGPPPRRRRWIRTSALIALGVLGLGALGGGGFAVVRELTRPPTTAEVTAAGDAETRLRWRFRSAGEIFPATVPYMNGWTGDKRTARRIGIAPAAGCAQALDREVAQVVARHGCVTVLRATYADQSGTLLMTLGIAVMPDEDKADAAESALHGTGDRWGIRPVAFPDTAAERFGDAQRQLLTMQTNHTSYLFLSAEGWTDGRPKVKPGDRVEDFNFTTEILTTVIGRLARNAVPCKAKEIQC